MTAPAPRPLRLAVVSAGLSQPSSTRLLADRLAAATVSALRESGVPTDVETVELREVAREIANNLVTGFPSPRLDEIIRSVTTADGLVATTPIFTTSYSGLFKSFVDVLDPQSLVRMPVLLGATGGSERHSLALDYAMRPLFVYLKAIVVPTGVYAASSDWGAGDGETGASPLADRVARAGRELADLMRTNERPPVVRDPFESSATGLGGFQPE